MKADRIIGLGLGASMALCLAAPGFAQTQTSPQAPAASDDSGLATIVVTAQRKSESLQKAALPVDVMSGSMVAKIGLSSVNQLQQVSPALSVAPAGGANSTFFVRGVGNFNTNAYSDPSTAFNYDGVYVGHSAGTAALLYDLDSVEVLKGPQGTLYGRNAAAGAVNVIPIKPKLGVTSGDVSLSVGNYNAINFQGAINLPLGQSTAVRLSGVHAQHDGYLSDGTSDQNITGFRAQLLQQVTPDLTVRFDVDVEQQRGKGGGATYDAIVTAPALNTLSSKPTGLGNNVGLLDSRAQAVRQAQFSGQAGANLPALPTGVYQHDNFVAALADVEYKTSIGTFALIPAYRHSDVNDVHVSPGFPIHNQEIYDQSSLELRLGGGNRMFDYIVGGYYFDEIINANDLINQQTLASYQNFRNETKSAAFFGRLTWKITDKFRATGGYRYTNEKKSLRGNATTLLDLGSGYFTLAEPASAQPVKADVTFPAQINAAQSVNKSTFRGALEYDVAPRILAYASVETGFHGGGFSLAPGYETYAPETITAYTIGLKSRLLDNHLQLNLEAFDWKYKNQQVSHFGINGAGFPDFFTQNIGASTIKGLDADAQYRVLTNTTLHASLQYLDSKFDSFAYNLPAAGGTPVTGCATSGSAATSYTVDCTGRQGFNSPKWTATLGAVQAIPLHNGLKLELAADTLYRSSRMVGFEYLASELAPADWRTNASVTLSQESWSISAYVRNIGNNRAISSSTYYGSGSLVVNRREDPRTFGIRFTGKI